MARGPKVNVIRINRKSDMESLFRYLPPRESCQVLNINQNFNVDLKNELLEVLDTNSISVENCIVLSDQSILPIESVKSMSKFSNITNLLNAINNSGLCKGKPVNGCVVNYYPSNSMRTSPHNDKEPYVDQESTICTYSLGGTRRFNIYKMNLRNPSLSYELMEGSLMLMDPGSQEISKHLICSLPNVLDQPRWSLSFRHFIRAPVDPKQWPYEPEKTQITGSSPVSVKIPELDDILDTSKLSSPKFRCHQRPPRHLTAEKLVHWITSADMAACKEILIVTRNRIEELERAVEQIKEGDMDSLVTFLPNFIQNQDRDDKASPSSSEPEEFVDNLLGEVKSLGLESQDGAKSYWLMENPSLTPFLHGKSFHEFPCLDKLKNNINNNEMCVGNTNSCLIRYYPTGEVGTRPHSDSDMYICQETSICNLSLGSTRKLSFYNGLSHSSSSPPIKTYDLPNCSMLIMQPNCQRRLTHAVHQSNTNTGRYCLSFRRVKSLESPKNENIEDESTKAITVILGTSITKFIKPDKIVGQYHKNSVEVINCSTSGHKISDLSKNVDELYKGTHPLTASRDDCHNLKVQNFIISVGTNDIRYRKYGVRSLYLPLRSLLYKIRNLYPNSKIFVQSCIPMMLEMPWTAQNVNNYNQIQRRCCDEVVDCTYVNVFDDFLDKNPARYPLRDLFYDAVHPSKKGVLILARAFIKIARGNISYSVMLDK